MVATHSYWTATALAHFFAGDYRAAAQAADKSLVEHSTYPPALRIKIVSLACSGEINALPQVVLADETEFSK